MNKKLLLISFLFFSLFNVYCQNKINIGKSCSYYGEKVPMEAYTFSSDNESKAALKLISDASGLSPNFTLVAGNVPNACATMIFNENTKELERYIIYNQTFMYNITQKINYWASISILAHEVGHHLNGHSLIPGGSRPSLELEADKFSGFILAKLGATLDDAQSAINSLVSEQGSVTHPPKSARLAAIANGWYQNSSSERNTKINGNESSLDIEAKTRTAASLFLKGEYENANQEISNIQKVDASNPILYRLAAYGNYELGKKAATKEQADRFFLVGLSNINLFFSKANPSKILISDYEYAGRLNANAGNIDAAVEYLKKAMTLDPTRRAEFYGEIGDIYNKARRYSDAASAFETRNYYLQKVSASDYFTVGRAYYFSKNFVSADSAFSKVIAAKPEAYLGYLWRAKTNAQIDTALQFSEATTFFKQFLMMVDTSTADKSKFKKDQQDALSYLMTYNVQKDNIPLAKEYAGKVLAIDPANNTAQRIINFKGTSRR
jgi:tetratricopeptide (TPR) repeat protein